MAHLPPTGPDTVQITSDAFDVQVSIDVDDVVTRLLNETRRLLNDLSQQDLTDDVRAQAVMDGLGALSDVPAEEAGRAAVSEGFNLGRNAEIQRSLDTIQRVVRTEVLDGDTCEACFGLDFTRSKMVYQVNSPAYWRDMPPNHCFGRESCRGFMFQTIAPSTEPN